MKGKRPGTVEECFKKGQIRRYGVKALDDGLIDVLVADRAYDRYQKAKAKRPPPKPRPKKAKPVRPKTVSMSKKKKQKEYIDEIVADIKRETRGGPIDEIKIKKPDRNTVYYMEDLLDAYNDGHREEDSLKKADRIMNELSRKKSGSSVKTGIFTIKKLSDYEYQLNYTNKKGDHTFVTSTKDGVRDFLYQIDIGLILWQNDKPTLITEVKF